MRKFSKWQPLHRQLRVYVDWRRLIKSLSRTNAHTDTSESIHTIWHYWAQDTLTQSTCHCSYTDPYEDGVDHGDRVNQNTNYNRARICTWNVFFCLLPASSKNDPHSPFNNDWPVSTFKPAWLQCSEIGFHGLGLTWSSKKSSFQNGPHLSNPWRSWGMLFSREPRVIRYSWMKCSSWQNDTNTTPRPNDTYLSNKLLWDFDILGLRSRQTTCTKTTWRDHAKCFPQRPQIGH